MVLKICLWNIYFDPVNKMPAEGPSSFQRLLWAKKEPRFCNACFRSASWRRLHELLCNSWKKKFRDCDFEAAEDFMQEDKFVPQLTAWMWKERLMENPILILVHSCWYLQGLLSICHHVPQMLLSTSPRSASSIKRKRFPKWRRKWVYYSLAVTLHSNKKGEQGARCIVCNLCKCNLENIRSNNTLAYFAIQGR